MGDARQTGGERTELPRQFVDRLTQPFEWLVRFQAAGGAVLLSAAVVALVLSNSPWAEWSSSLWETPVSLRLGSHSIEGSLRDWINDALMTLFFFLVALELKRELVLGELRNPRRAGFPIVAALGGMVVPAALYLALQLQPPGRHGWGVVMATDTAFVLGCLGLLGSRLPPSLRVFMLSLAIVDDIGAVLVVAIGYSGQIGWGWLALAGLGVAATRALALAGVRRLGAYFLVGGLVWLAVDAAGIHPTISGVALGLLTPARRWISDERLYAILGQVVAHPPGDFGSGATRDRETLQMAEVAARESLSPVERLEHALNPWVAFLVMPLFALANAGVPIAWDRVDGSVTIAVFVGFVFGKPLGVLAFSLLAVRAGVAVRPPELSWGLLVGGGFLAGIGFTMALFIANLGLGFDPTLVDSAKLGILSSSLVSASAGLAVLWWLSRARVDLAEPR